MKKLLLTLLVFTVACGVVYAEPLKPRIVFEKYLFAEGLDPIARDLTSLKVKFFDEDMVRLRNGELISTNGRNDLTYTKDFIARHPEIEIQINITNKSEAEYAKQLLRAEEMSGWDLVDQFSFYRFRLLGTAENPRELLADILQAPEIEIAWYEGIPIDLTCQDLGNPTPSYLGNQTYHDPAPTGTDLDYAQALYGADVVDGAGTSVYTGIFERGMQTTHEDVTLADVGTAGTPDADNNHGTAVMGILGACDDNNVGCLGFLADQRMRLYQRNSSSYASVADIYNLANSQLLAGELTNSSWGYFANPMPPGQSCPCNPGQNGVVCIEYEADVKAEVQAGVAAGIHYFLAAGNGCVNMDNATFGTTFRNSTSTGSNYIGAVKSTLPHDSSCFTNWGERVDLCGWGDGIYSTGYNTTVFVPSSRDEWYASGFGGTSGASPMVGGVAGVLNNIYRSLNAGDNISPATMTSWLQVNGTNAGAFPGVDPWFPNLFGILAPDLIPYQPAGWSNSAVPRNTNDATAGSCLLPANLNSTPDPTFWNGAKRNVSVITSASSYSRLYRDDVYIVWIGGTLLPNQWGWGGNIQSDMRGGRHTVRNTVDPLGDVAEFDETNNDDVNQYVWDPVAITDDDGHLYSRPPTRVVTGQSGSYYNCDGYVRTSSSGWWEILAVQASSATADYDARFYSEAITSTNGFDTYEVWSALVGNADIDFVGINNNVQGGNLLASVINWDDEDVQYSVDVDGSTVLANPDSGRNYYGTYTITTNELFEVFEFYIEALETHTIEVDVTSGDADLVISVFGPSNDYYSRSGALFASNANDGPGDEFLTFTPGETGWYGVVVHKDDFNDWQETATFDLYIGEGAPDFTHNLNAGWSHKIVMTQTPASPPVVLPATLNGNTSPNYFNAGYINQGFTSNLSGTMRDSLYLDGPGVYQTGFWAVYAPGAITQWLNRNIGLVFGGKHSVGDIIDVFEAQPEWDETNNRHDEQFVWTPYPLNNDDTFLTSVTAPNWRDFNSSVVFADFNVHGWEFTGTFWSGVGMTPLDPDDEYNCYLYDPATSSTSGFETRRVNSWATGSNTEWVVENGNINGLGSTFDVGVNNNWAWPGTVSEGNYRIHQSNSIVDLVNNAANGPFSMPAGHLINCFDFYLLAGDATPIILDNLGAADLGFAIYDPDLSYGSRSTNTLLVNTNGDGLNETTEFIPTTTGFHGLVVFKNDYTDLVATDYRLIIGDIPVVPPMPPTELTLIWDANSPPFVLCTFRWEPVTTDINGNPLTVEWYELYYTLDPNEEYGPGWVSGGILPGSITEVQASFPDTWTQARFVFVAIDDDGLALSVIGDPGTNPENLQSIVDSISRNGNHGIQLIPSESSNSRE